MVKVAVLVHKGYLEVFMMLEVRGQEPAYVSHLGSPEFQNRFEHNECLCRRSALPQ